MTIKADTAPLAALAKDLDAAAALVTIDLRAVVKRGAVNIKKDWRSAAKRSAGAHGKHYPRSIDFDLSETGDLIEAEIGPNTALPQGGMGRGFEYGSINTSPKPDGAKALAAEEPRFVAACEDVAVAALSHRA
jgi:hypothetical protein